MAVRDHTGMGSGVARCVVIQVCVTYRNRFKSHHVYMCNSYLCCAFWTYNPSCFVGCLFMFM